ncbi:MAG: RnfABCDGE type electron transport complex subunit D [Lachnospiraceae bacterium]|nr:RnfABCDGE type electron transport complex subunit D [Lachnospiraceae bacterium]
MNEKYRVSSNPHIRARATTTTIMLAVIIALLPTTVVGILNFGMHALLLVLTTTATCVISELLFTKLMKKKTTIGDCSAAVTGLLLGLNLPPRAPWWIGVIGGVFAIIVVKQLFGGLGQNFMNPALGARCFLVLSFARIMTDFNTDTYTGATPLALLKAGERVNIYNMVMGKTAGTIGEVSMIAIVGGACFLLLLGVIDLRIPGTYIVTLILFLILFSGRGLDYDYIAGNLAGGGLMLGAFFMATDYVTRPITKRGQYVYGVLLGILTGIFRVFGSGAEGVSYAIILSNLCVPLIEKISWPKPFGRGGERA